MSGYNLIMLYKSEDDARSADVMDTIDAATKAGFSDQAVDEGHVLCGKPSTMELVDVFPDGSWEYQAPTEEGTMTTMSGANAALLALYLANDENKKIFEENEG